MLLCLQLQHVFLSVSFTAVFIYVWIISSLFCPSQARILGPERILSYYLRTALLFACQVTLQSDVLIQILRFSFQGLHLSVVWLLCSKEMLKNVSTPPFCLQMAVLNCDMDNCLTFINCRNQRIVKHVFSRCIPAHMKKLTRCYQVSALYCLYWIQPVSKRTSHERSARPPGLSGPELRMDRPQRKRSAAVRNAAQRVLQPFP